MRPMKYMIPVLGMMLVICSGTASVYGQQIDESQPSTEEATTDDVFQKPDASTDQVIKLLTDAPERESYASEEEYSAVKKAWVEQNPRAYKMITGRDAAESPAESSTKVPMEDE